MLSIWPSNQAPRRAGHSRARPDRGRVRCSPRTSGERCFDAPKAVRATHVAALKSNRVLPPLPTEGLHRPLRFSITHQCAVVREDGTDREQRDGARQIYEEGIRKSPVPRGQKLWQGIHDHWGEAQVASADAPLNVRCWTKADIWPERPVTVSKPRQIPIALFNLINVRATYALLVREFRNRNSFFEFLFQHFTKFHERFASSPNALFVRALLRRTTSVM
jgi:hypothetical protein